MEIENLSIVINVAVESAVNNVQLLADKVSDFARKDYTFNVFNNFAYQAEHLKSYVEDAEQKLLTYKQNTYEQDFKNFKSSMNSKISELKSYYANQQTMAKEASQAEIRYIKENRDSRIKSYEEEIAYLNSLIKGIRTQNQDNNDLKKIDALYDQLKYEKDDLNRYYLEKAIEKAESEYNERKQIESIQDQIDAYKEQISTVKENAQAEIDAVQAAADAKISAIKAQQEAEIQALQTMLAQKENAYKKAQQQLAQSLKSYEDNNGQIQSSAQKTVKSITDYVQAGQEENIYTLNAYKDRYYYAGSVLGGEFASAFNNHLVYLEGRLSELQTRMENLLYTSAGLYNTSSVQNVSNVNSVGGITQNFYAGQSTPYEARKMAEDLINSIF